MPDVINYQLNPVGLKLLLWSVDSSPAVTPITPVSNFPQHSVTAATSISQQSCMILNWQNSLFNAIIRHQSVQSSVDNLLQINAAEQQCVQLESWSMLLLQRFVVNASPRELLTMPRERHSDTVM